MPRRRNWKKSAVKQGLRTNVTEEVGLAKNTTGDIDLTEEVGLGKNTTRDLTIDVTEKVGLGKNTARDLCKNLLENLLENLPEHLPSNVSNVNITNQLNTAEGCECSNTQTKEPTTMQNTKIDKAQLGKARNAHSNVYSEAQGNEKSRAQSCVTINEPENQSQTLMNLSCNSESFKENSNSSVKNMWASFSQSNVRFSQVSRGRQCTCNALMMLLYSKHKQEFTTSILDEILNQGDDLYHNVVSDVVASGKFISYLLQFEDLPSTVQTCLYTFNIVRENIIVGTFFEIPNVSFLQTLDSAVRYMMEETGMGLIMAGAICSAVFKDDEDNFLFLTRMHTDKICFQTQVVKRCFLVLLHLIF